jgi:hypothetical protein
MSWLLQMNENYYVGALLVGIGLEIWLPASWLELMVDF